MKIIPYMEHYIYTGYRISSEQYEGKNNQIGRTSQGNIVSGHGCQDSSYFNLKEVEKSGKGAVLYVPGTKIRANMISITFVNDTNHYANGE